jgi:hypothetical protein
MVFPFAVNCLAGRLVRPYALSQQVCSGPQIASFRRAKRNRPCFSSPTVVAGLRSVAYAICHAGTSRKTRPDFTYSFHFHDRGIFTIPAFSEMDRRKRGAAIHRILLDNLDRAGELLECRKVKNPMCKTASAISKKAQERTAERRLDWLRQAVYLGAMLGDLQLQSSPIRPEVAQKIAATQAGQEK